MGGLENFSKNVSLWVPTYLQNILRMYWICLVKTLLLRTNMTLFEVKIFWSKKSENHSFLLTGSNSYFFNLINIQIVNIFRFLRVFSMERYRWPLLKRTRTLFNSCFLNFYKSFAKISPVFRENAKNLQNHSFFWGGGYGKSKFF